MIGTFTSFSSVDLSATGKTLIVDLKVGGTKTQALLDTGSTFSVINSNFATSQNYTRAPCRQIAFLFANGQRQVINESITIPVEFDNFKMEMEIYVSPSLPSKYNLIIGIDFCKLFNIGIIFGDNQASVCTTLLQNTLFAISHDVTINPGEHEIIQLSNRGIKDGTTMLIPVNIPSLAHNISFPNILVLVVNFICYAIIANQSKLPLIFPKNTNLFQTDNLVNVETEVSNFPLFTISESENNYHVNEKLTKEEKDQLEKLLENYTDIFAHGYQNMPATNIIQHSIPFFDESAVVSVRPYRLSPKEAEILETKASELLKAGFIRPSTSAFSNPVLLLRKPNGDYRFVEDFRRVNKLTRKDTYAMPRIDSTIDELSGQTWFTSIDMANGFYSVPLKESDMHKTSFLTARGSFEWTRMAMGLTGAPSTYTRMMDHIFRDIRGKSITYFFDDVVILGKTFPEHLDNIKLVFDRIREANLRLQRRKCFFAEKQIKFLGYQITAGTVSPDPFKLLAITEMPRPTSLEQVQSFLGKCSYYRNFIRDFSKHAAPIYALTTMKEIKWTPEADEQFKFFQSKLTTAPILSIFVPSLEVILECDASGYGLGCCVTQKKDKKDHPIAYFSRMMNKSERKYNTSEQELLSIIFGIKMARHWIYGSHFTIITDHAALTWILNLKDTKNRRLAAWNSLLNGYDFTIIHRAGKRHANSDCLSRNPIPLTIPESQDSDLGDMILFSSAIAAIEPDDAEIVGHQNNDTFCQEIKHMSENEKEKHNYLVENGIIKKRAFLEYSIKNLIVLPLSLFDKIYEECHDHCTASHQSVTRTTYRISQTFYRPKLITLVSDKVRKCSSCQLNKPRNRQLNSIPGLMPHSNIPMDIISIDLSGPWPTSIQGNKYTISAIDCATRYLIVGAIPDKKMETVAKFILDKVYFVYSFPRVLTTDRGKEFLNNLLSRINSTLGINHRKTTSFNPTANSIVERSNRNLSAALRHYVQAQSELWEQYLPQIVYALNTSIHETLGTSPYFLLYLREPTNLSEYKYQRAGDVRVIKQLRLIEKIRNDVEKRLINNQLKTQARDAKKFIREEFERGDLVLLDMPYLMTGQSTKLQARYRGPYIVEEKVDDQDALYVVRKLHDTNRKSKYERVNLKHMKRYVINEDINGEKENEHKYVNVTTTGRMDARAPGPDQPVNMSNDDYFLS